MSADRAAYKTFRPGDLVTVRRVIRSAKWRGHALHPGVVGTVDRMEQCVWVRFPAGNLPMVWMLYDGDLTLVRRP